MELRYRLYCLPFWCWCIILTLTYGWGLMALIYLDQRYRNGVK